MNTWDLSADRRTITLRGDETLELSIADGTPASGGEVSVRTGGMRWWETGPAGEVICHSGHNAVVWTGPVVEAPVSARKTKVAPKPTDATEAPQEPLTADAEATCEVVQED